MKKNPFYLLVRKISEFSKNFLFPYFFFILIFLIIYAEKPSKLKKAICSFIFLFFSQCSNFFLAVRKIFFSGSFCRKKGSGTLLKFLVALRPLEITKLGSLANFFYLMNLKNNFLTATKNFLIAKREK